ncbi:hypothetical protein [Allosphingosinicella sp.]|uniref:hypothetical protein n=1 Tax=Allosphingosinicella sp. TaxID=2823234 RepID=UPI003784E7B7
MDDAQTQLDGFIDKFTPEMAALTRALFARMKARLPGAAILVYDNYNALAIGFAAGERVKDVVLSLAVYPRWVSLFFMQGRWLADPDGLLKGEGNMVRHIPAITEASIDDPRIEALIEAALDQAPLPIDPSAEPLLVIKSISAKQRPRRPNG